MHYLYWHLPESRLYGGEAPLRLPASTGACLSSLAANVEEQPLPNQ